MKMMMKMILCFLPPLFAALFCFARCNTYVVVCLLVFVASIIKLFSSFGGNVLLVWFGLQV
jgi:hypothetical protein